MQLSYNETAEPEGRLRLHLFQAVVMWTTYPLRYVYFDCISWTLPPIDLRLEPLDAAKIEVYKGL